MGATRAVLLIQAQEKSSYLYKGRLHVHKRKEFEESNPQ